MKKNKGEWAELFVGLLLLDRRNVPLWNSKKIAKIDSVYYSELISPALSRDQIQELVVCFRAALKSQSGSFSIVGIPSESPLGFVKGASRSKRDVFIRYSLDGISMDDPFGIKSYLAAAPTLLNSSSATNFRYSVKGSSSSHVSGPKQVVAAIGRENLQFETCVNPIFKSNLLRVDSGLDVILSKILLAYYSGVGSGLSILIESCFSGDELERVKIRIKDFLYYVCVGIFPARLWDGNEEIVGVVVLDKGENLFVLHRLEINEFKNYLLEHSKLDTPSPSKHKFGKVFELEGRYWLDLNLQIRMT